VVNDEIGADDRDARGEGTVSDRNAILVGLCIVILLIGTLFAKVENALKYIITLLEKDQ
jgi:hypothetical protein